MRRFESSPGHQFQGAFFVPSHSQLFCASLGSLWFSQCHEYIVGVHRKGRYLESQLLALCIPVRDPADAGSHDRSFKSPSEMDPNSQTCVRTSCAFYQPGAISNRRICPKPAGAAPKFDTYNRPSGPNVIPVGTNSPVTTSSISPDLLTRTTLPANGDGPGPAASDSSRTYSNPSGPKSTATTVVNSYDPLSERHPECGRE